MSHPQRLVSIDLLRTLAILLMLINHALPFLSTSTHPYLVYLFYLTTFSSALFLFLTGFLLSYRHRHTSNQSSWLKHKLFRSLLLLFLSYLLYLLNPQTNKHPASTGILQTVAILWLVFSFLLAQAKTKTVTIVSSLSFLFVTSLSPFLTASHLHLPFLTTYSFPLFPFSTYFLLGLVVGLTNPTFLQPVLVFLASVIVLSFSGLSHPFFFGVFSDLHTHAGHWQPGFLLNLFTLSLIYLLFITFTRLEKAFHRLSRLALPGSHSLGIYTLHLVIIYSLSRLNLLSKYPINFSTTLAFLILGSYSYPFFHQIIFSKLQPRRRRK